MLERMNRFCDVSTVRQQTRPLKHEQRLLRIMGVYMDLQIPYARKKDVQVNELMRLVHEFLQRFSVGTKRTRRCSTSTCLFFTPSLLEAQTVCAIFLDNAQLCGELGD